MMPDFYLCDICRANIPKHARIAVTLGRLDAAGDMADVFDEYVLCHRCMSEAIKAATLDDDTAKTLVAWVRLRIRLSSTAGRKVVDG